MLTEYQPPKKKRRKPPEDYEHKEQAAVIEWATMMTWKYPELERLHAVPNGGKRHPATAKKLKAEGVKAGFPDMGLPVPRGGYHGFYCELKAIYPDGTTGTVSDKQQEWIDFLRGQGYRVVVAYGWEQATAAIEDYLQNEG